MSSSLRSFLVVCGVSLHLRVFSKLDF
jgi:hypothetical protein